MLGAAYTVPCVIPTSDIVAGRNLGVGTSAASAKPTAPMVSWYAIALRDSGQFALAFPQLGLKCYQPEKDTDKDHPESSRC